MTTHRFSYIAVIGIILGMASPGFSEDGAIVLAQSGSTVEQRMTRDQAIDKATEIKQGILLKATLEKRDNQVVWEVKIQGGNNTISYVLIDPKSHAVIKSIDGAGGK